MIVNGGNNPGILEKLINPLAQNQINITMIKSQAMLTQTDGYLFFLDVDADMEQAKFQKALNQLAQEPFIIKLLGSYPKAVL